jgi:hypothetical protein
MSKIKQTKTLYIPCAKWQSISMDFIVNLPRTKRGHNDIFVMLDHQLTHAHFVSSKTIAMIMETILLFVKRIYKIHKLLREIMFGRNSKFVNAFWTMISKTLGTKLCLNTTYHHELSSQTKKIN